MNIEMEFAKRFKEYMENPPAEMVNGYNHYYTSYMREMNDPDAYPMDPPVDFESFIRAEVSLELIFESESANL